MPPKKRVPKKKASEEGKQLEQPRKKKTAKKRNRGVARAAAAAATADDDASGSSSEESTISAVDAPTTTTTTTAAAASSPPPARARPAGPTFDAIVYHAYAFIEKLDAGMVLLNLKETKDERIVNAIVSALTRDGLVRRELHDELLARLLRLESAYPQALGHAFDVLATDLPGLKGSGEVAVFVRLARAVNCLAPDKVPTRFIIVYVRNPDMLGNLDFPLGDVALLFMLDQTFHGDALRAKNRVQLLAAMRAAVARHARTHHLIDPHLIDEAAEAVAAAAVDGTASADVVVDVASLSAAAASAAMLTQAADGAATTAAGDKFVHDGDVDELVCTRRFAGGLRRDARAYRRRLLSDFGDALRSPGKVLAATCFLTVACLTPNVAFGGLVAEATHNQIGVMEMMLSSAVAGIVYALFAGQPLTILGGSGPYLIFVQVLYAVCDAAGLADAFLAVYAWSGLWAAAMLVAVALSDASSLIRHATRYTNEVFSALIGAIFIYEAFASLLRGFFVDNASDAQLASALLTFMLGFGTFAVNNALQNMRRSAYLLRTVREFLADFGSVLAIVVVALAAALAVPQVKTARLSLPAGLEPSVPRAWLVPLGDAGVGGALLAIVPGVFLAVLVFLNNNITVRLVNQKDHALRKRAGIHLDTLVSAVLVAAASLFGLPWIMAATVRSLNHLRALAALEENAAGHGAPHVVAVLEQRVTPLLIHVLLLLAALVAEPLLRALPVAPLYGILLFMGVSSLKSNQLVDRLRLLLTEPALRPPSHYVRRVRLWKINAFTGTQFVALVVLWIVKSTPAGIAFPLLVALLIPFRRYVLPRWFDDEELAALDADKAVVAPAEEDD